MCDSVAKADEILSFYVSAERFQHYESAVAVTLMMASVFVLLPESSSFFWRNSGSGRPTDVQRNMVTPRPDEWYAIMSTQSGQVLDVRQNKEAQIWPFQYGREQMFKFHAMAVSAGEIEYRIVDLDKGQAVTLTKIGLINQVSLSTPDNLSKQQRWFIRGLNLVVGQFVSVDSGECLDVTRNLIADGTSVTTWNCGNDKPNQKWTLLPLC